MGESRISLDERLSSRQHTIYHSLSDFLDPQATTAPAPIQKGILLVERNCSGGRYAEGFLPRLRSDSAPVLTRTSEEGHVLACMSLPEWFGLPCWEDLKDLGVSGTNCTSMVSALGTLAVFTEAASAHHAMRAAR